MENILRKREDVEKSLTWDLTHIYDTEDEFNADVKKMKEYASEIEKKYNDKLTNPNTINECLNKLKDLQELMNLTFYYVALPVREDQTNICNLERSNKFMNLMAEVNSKLSFIKSELMQTNDNILNSAIGQFKENSNYLKEIQRNKPHTLHKETERVLSALSVTLESAEFIYNQAKLADMQFDNFSVDGKEYPLSFVSFESEWQYEKDTKLRRAAFHAFSSKLRQYQNTIAAAYQTQVQKEKIISSLRGFNSVFDSLLFEQKVDVSLFNRQIDVIMEKLAPHMRKYAKLLQKVHKIEKMTFADLKIELDPEYNPEVTIDKARQYIENALSVMGQEYLEVVKAEYDQRGIDFVRNIGKFTGAFCASPYKKLSYILISWCGKMHDVFTLAHELGHALHFYYADRNQSIFDVEPSGYFTEAPSTINEIILARYILSTSDDVRLKRWVLSSLVGKTYYNNFVTHLLEAAYQREVYKIIENGGSVHAQKLCQIKKEILEKFWGEDIIINDGAELTWMRQHHYYIGMYPYTYSAGLTIATEVSKRIFSEGQDAVDDWINVLKAGGTKTPAELAEMAGVDITTDTSLLNTIEYIGDMVDEIIELTDKI